MLRARAISRARVDVVELHTQRYAVAVNLRKAGKSEEGGRRHLRMRSSRGADFFPNTVSYSSGNLNVC